MTLTLLFAPALSVLLGAPVPAAAATPGPPSTGPVAIDSVVSRSSFDAVVAAGPQRLVASVDVAPAVRQGRFLGFRIVRFKPDGELAACTSLLPGDVVLTVNREPIERPEQFMRAWDVVKGASEVEVEVLRGEQRLVYRWKVAP